MPATAAWLASVEALLNRRIAEVTRAQNAARRLEGTALRLDVEGVWSVRLAVRGGRLLLAPPEEGAPVDVRMRGTPGALANLGLRLAGLAAPLRTAAAATGRAGRTGSASASAGASAGAGAGATGGGGGVHIEGDAEIAACYRELLASARPEPEEELARHMGDLPARSIMRALEAASAFARRARRTAAEDLAEYLTEESRTLVGRGELEEFLLEVDRVRETFDRIEARLARLEHTLKRGAR